MLTAEQQKEIVEKLGSEAGEQIKKQFATAEQNLNAKLDEVKQGLMTEKEFKAFKDEEMSKVNESLAVLAKMDEAVKEQGNKINALIERAAPASKSFEQFLTEQAPKIKELHSGGKFMEITATELKAAGVTSISGSVQDMTSAPTSPYAPGIGGADLEIFDIARNPNYIINHVDLGRTNTSRLAWANETDYQGAPAEVDEGNTKPLTQHKFQVELSQAKKMAAYIELTEEFDQDLPGFATRTRRMLQDDVIRGTDDAIQAAVIAAAHSFDITGLNNKIDHCSMWDAVLALMGQVGYYNFMPNTVGINPLTNVMMKTEKDEMGAYLLPPFVGDINNLLVQANKVAVNYALVGDLKQYKVDIYKEFVLKVGWINDNLIQNKFCIVGEMRYHRYISDARKKAIVYDNISRGGAVQNVIYYAGS